MKKKLAMSLKQNKQNEGMDKQKLKKNKTDCDMGFWKPVKLNSQKTLVSLVCNF